jgi:predicted ATP-dependent protease
VTGAIEIVGEDPKDPGSVRVSPVGGIGDKARGAESWGIKYVVVPMENFEHSTSPTELRDMKTKVMGARTVRDYLVVLRGDKIAS